MESITSELAALRSDVKSLIKLVKQVKTFQEDPTGEKRKTRAANNGFNRKMEVTDELKNFLKLADGETISRSDVTRRINKYITENGLKHPDNGRVIIMDDGLKNLLKPPEDVTVTFLNIQKYLSPHYVKVGEEAVIEESVVSSSEPEVTSEPKKAKRPTVRKPKA